MDNRKSAWEYGLSTHRGAVRKINEDNALLKVVTDPDGNELTVVMVADGMGGYQAGDVASKTVVDQMNSWVDEHMSSFFNEEDPLEAIAIHLEKFLHDTNHHLMVYGNRKGLRLGTTASILLLYQRKYLVVHVGDSRIYHVQTASKARLSQTEEIVTDDADTDVLSGGMKLRQITEDHSWVNDQVKRGAMTKQEANTHPKRNVLMQCLGIDQGIKPYLSVGTYADHDLFLLCSDGFYNVFPDKEILLYIQQAKIRKQNLQSFTDYLVDEANSAGASDNVTVSVVKALPQTEQGGWGKKISGLFRLG